MRVVPMLAAAAVLAACHAERATAPSQAAALAASKSSNTPVTSLIADSDAAIAPALQIRSDGLGAYLNSSTLTSVIQSIGAWVLDSYDPANATRTVYLGFSQPIAGSGPNGGAPVPVPSGLYKVHMISKCNLYGTNMLTIAPGVTTPCPLHVKFQYGASQYAVQMNPYMSASDTAYAETNYANVTCAYPASGPGPCTQWTITPSGTFTAPDGSTAYENVGKLLKYVTSGRTTVAANQGDFDFSFEIGVTNP
jgi:hypothetical protein